MKISINYIEPTVCTARFGQLCGEQAILTAIKRATPEIERRVLRGIQNVAAGMPPVLKAGALDAVDIVAEARGISLEDE